jgi:hypothetical protein
MQYPAPTRRKASLPRLALALLAIAASVFAVYRLAAPSASAKAGDCVAISHYTANGTGDGTTAGCDDEKATFQVGKVLVNRGENCPDGRDEYTVLVDAKAGTLCLLPHLVEGACYQPDVRENTWRKAECANRDGIRVTRVLAGTADGGRCPRESDALSYEEPPITYCFTAVGV